MAVVKTLYPFQEHSLEINGFRCHYLDEGSGEPLVMLHGNPTWSFYYRNVVRALSSSYRCIAPDHIGCGLSEKPLAMDYPYTLERRVDDLETLLERLEVTENLTLILHDWGGMIGMAAAARHPARVRRIVVLNTAAFHLPAGMKLPWSLRLCRTSVLGAPLVRGLNAFGRSAAVLCAKKRPLPLDVRAAYLAPYDSWRNRIALHRFVQDIPLVPGDASYEAVSRVEAALAAFAEHPMLICWGERDFVFNGRFLAEWTRRFPHAEVHRYPEAGHYVLEDAGEEIVTVLKRFLEAHPLNASVSTR